jgi:hypothetical protein
MSETKPKLPPIEGEACSHCGEAVPANPQAPEWVPHTALDKDGNYFAWSHNTCGPCKGWPNYKGGFLSVAEKSLSVNAKRIRTRRQRKAARG